MSKGRFVVTGGAGFIGSHLVRSLLTDGYRVDVIDNFDPFYPRAMKEENLLPFRAMEGFRFFETDIRDLDGLKNIFQEEEPIETVVHLAARAGVRPSIEDPVGYQETNVRGTQNLLELTRKAGVSRFIFASSSSVYGVDPKVPWSEAEAGLKPISPYAATKVSGELLGHVYSHLYGIRFIALRFFTVYGPGQRPDLAIRKFSLMARQGQSVPFFGDGSTSRDYTYIGDIIRGIRAAIAYEGSPYEVNNLGNSRTVSLEEMVRILEEKLDVPIRKDFQPLQPGDVPVTFADVTKAGRLLGWKPEVPFEEGIARFVRWLRERDGN
jgi:UDP-glucuronate 4-epimerase